ncbi:MAG: bifunctional folylpolyglutamate synthase/dihydrofolate synthase [bacterium]|nr:bifunctional folylpolyglutamate synthase/dihydrofolate synthase [bacterium]
MIPEDPVDFLLSLSRSEYLGMKPGLERIRELLEKLHRPEDAFRSVLVGGTNGKGSTAVILASLLSRVAGKNGKPFRLGLYLSPHLVNLEERILVGGRPVSREGIRDTARRLLIGEKTDSERDRWTFFEFITAIAFDRFREGQVELAVAEVGLGGRLDATNVLNPLASIITNISREHTEWLGASEREIAGEKAGIIREGRTVITGAEGDALAEIRRMAAGKGARVLSLGRDFAVERTGAGFDYRGPGSMIRGLTLPGPGDYQIRNAALALAAFEILAGCLDFSPREEEIRAGLEGFRIPGRMQRIEREGRTIVLDGAHNPGAARVLSEELKNAFPGRKARLVFTAMRDKEVDKILEEILPLASRVILVDLGGKRAFPPAELEKIIRRRSADLELGKASGMEAALDLAREGCGQEEYLLVTGSLYLVGEALRALDLPGYVEIN